MDDNIVKSLFVGLNTVDLQFFVEGFPQTNTKTKANKNEIAAGGPATNAAIACSFLGGQATLVSPIGKHSLSRFLVDDIINHKVLVVDPIKTIEGKPVFASIITDEINGERTVFSYHPDTDYKQLLNELNIHRLKDNQIALFDGFFLDIAIAIARELKEAGITTVLDGGSWKPGLEELLPYIDIAICSNDFACPGAENVYDTVRCLDYYGIKQIAITRGEKPIFLFYDGNRKEIEVPKIKVVDTLGAGDFFHGAFCYYYAHGQNMEMALASASSIAAISCTFHGTRSWMKKFTSSDLRN